MRKYSYTYRKQTGSNAYNIPLIHSPASLKCICVKIRYLSLITTFYCLIRHKKSLHAPLLTGQKFESEILRLVWTKWMKGWFCIEEKTGKRMCRYAREQSLIYRIQVSASEKELVKSIPKLQSGPCWKTYSKKSACKFCRNLNSFNSSDWSVGSVFITTLLTLHYFSSDQNLEFLYDKLSS